MDENKIEQFFVNEDTLEKIVEAILTKIKQSTNALTSDAAGQSTWNTIVNGLTNGQVSDETMGGKAVSLELLAEVLLKGKFLSYELVVSDSEIGDAVSTPELNTIYLLKSTDTADTNVAMWMRLVIDGTESWISLGKVEVPSLKYIDTDSPDSVNNVVSHVNRGETDFAGSKNVQPLDIISAQGLTNILVALGYDRKVVVPYSESQGKSISETVGKPNVNAFYLYQQSEDENDWAVYTAAPVVNGETTKYVWLKISGAEGSAPVEVDLSNYWTKDELKPITADQVTEIIERASANVGI